VIAGESDVVRGIPKQSFAPLVKLQIDLDVARIGVKCARICFPCGRRLCLRNSPNGLNAVTKAAFAGFGAEVDSSTQNHPGDGGANKNEAKGEQASDHAGMMADSLCDVKYFVIQR